LAQSLHQIKRIYKKEPSMMKYVSKIVLVVMVLFLGISHSGIAHSQAITQAADTEIEDPCVAALGDCMKKCDENANFGNDLSRFASQKIDKPWNQSGFRQILTRVLDAWDDLCVKQCDRQKKECDKDAGR